MDPSASGDCDRRWRGALGMAVGASDCARRGGRRGLASCSHRADTAYLLCEEAFDVFERVASDGGDESDGSGDSLGKGAGRRYTSGKPSSARGGERGGE
eukprot:6177290-Pleurochrysis_carterae.AAC.6